MSDRGPFPQRRISRLRKPGPAHRIDIAWHLQGRETYDVDDDAVHGSFGTEDGKAPPNDSEPSSADTSDSAGDEDLHRTIQATAPPVFPVRRSGRSRPRSASPEPAAPPSAGKQRGSIFRCCSELTSEEAHHLLRSLVEQELVAEFASAGSTDSDDMPILTYLLRHFLLTLPIIRDDVDDRGRSIFWLAGLQPVLQSLYECDLSRSVDRKGSDATGPTVLAGAIERFVSSGLKFRHSATTDTYFGTSTPTREEAVSTAAPATTSPETVVRDIDLRRGNLTRTAQKKPPFWKRALGLGRSPIANSQAIAHPRQSPHLTARAARTGPSDAGDGAHSEAEDIFAALSALPEPHPPVRPSGAPTLPKLEPIGDLRARDVGLYDLAQLSVPGPRDSVLSNETFLTAPDQHPPIQPPTPPFPSAYHLESFPTSPPSEQAYSGLEPPPAVQPLLAKESLSGEAPARVDFQSGATFSMVRWGGFEVDVVGVRKHLISHSYILRVRRPGCLDEYVLRSDAEMQRFARKLAKALPHSHVPPFPTHTPQGDAFVKPPEGSEHDIGSEPWRRSSAHSLADSAGPSLFAPLPLTGRDSIRSAPLRASVTSPSGSRFTQSLRAQSAVSLGRYPRSRASSFSTHAPSEPAQNTRTLRSYAAGSGASTSGQNGALRTAPNLDGRRRVVRAWIRDVLSIRSVRQDTTILAFLFDKPADPRDRDVLDILQRKAVDNARRRVRLTEAQNSFRRLREAQQQRDELCREVIHGERLADLSEKLRTTSTLSELPARIRGLLEVLRFQVASRLFDFLIEGLGSRARFEQIKALRDDLPWGKIRKVLRVSKTSKMMEMLEDLLLGDGRSRSKTLLQKILTICLADDPKEFTARLNDLRARIGSSVMTTKLEQFVYESRQKKAVIRRYSEEYGLELVLCIVRGSDSPRLRQFELDRIVNAQQAYRKWTRTHAFPPARNAVRDPDIRLVIDLQDYLALVSEERDAAIVRSLLGQEDFARAIEAVAQPFLQLLRRLHAASDLAALAERSEASLDHLITVVGALRERVQDRDKSIRRIAKVLEEHEEALYAFLHDLHTRDDLVEECLQWAWTCAIFVRRGLARPVDFDALLPPAGSADRAALLAELEQLVASAKAERAAAYEATARQFGGEVDADDPVVVDGDGRGRPQLEQTTRRPKAKKPILKEIPRYAEAFREQLKSIFPV